MCCVFPTQSEITFHHHIFDPLHPLLSPQLAVVHCLGSNQQLVAFGWNLRKSHQTETKVGIGWGCSIICVLDCFLQAHWLWKKDQFLVVVGLLFPFCCWLLARHRSQLLDRGHSLVLAMWKSTVEETSAWRLLL